MIYAFGAASVAIQILTVLHIIRTGRNQLWVWVVVLFSLLGCTAYFAFELMPELFGPGSPHARRQAIVEDRDAVGKMQRAEARLAEVDTAANQIELADACYDMGAYGASADHFRKALDRMHARDTKIEMRLGEALLMDGRTRDARDLIEKVEAKPDSRDGFRRDWLMARCLAELGERQEAAGVYARVVDRLRDAEAHGHYAALLFDLGRESDARDQLSAILALRKTMPVPDAARHADLFAWAERRYQSGV